MKNMIANCKRINNYIENLATYSSCSDGVTRLTYSPEWKAALGCLCDIMSSLDMGIKIDPIGNLIGTAEGMTADSKPLAIGSHLDSIVNGGAYDRAMGIVVGLEFMSILKENSIYS